MPRKLESKKSRSSRAPKRTPSIQLRLRYQLRELELLEQLNFLERQLPLSGDLSKLHEVRLRRVQALLARARRLVERHSLH